MLYGYKIDGLSTIVVADDVLAEYTAWMGKNSDVHPDCFFEEAFTPGFLDCLTNPDYTGYKYEIRVFKHSSEDQQDQFIKKNEIKLVQSAIARDKQSTMLWAEKEEKKYEIKQSRKELYDAREKEINEIYKVWVANIEARQAALQARKDAGETIPPEDEIPDEDLIFYIRNEYEEQTIGQELGLAENDPWDSRDEEEIEQERINKEKFEKAKAAGKISGDSFSGPIERDPVRKPIDLRKPKTSDSSKQSANTDAAIAPEQIDVEPGKVVVTKVNVTTNADGTISVGSINAIKKGGEVDLEGKSRLEAEREEERRKNKHKLTPEEFAKRLRGDGRHDATGGATVAGDKVQVPKTRARKRAGLGK